MNKTKAIKKIRTKRRAYCVIQKILVIDLAKETKDLRKLSNLVQIPYKTIWRWTHSNSKKILKFQRMFDLWDVINVIVRKYNASPDKFVNVIVYKLWHYLNY